MIQIVKKIFLASIMAVAISGCKEEELETFDSVSATGRVVAADGASVASMTKDNDLVMVPIRVKLSGPAGKAFQVSIEPTTDTLNKLIANNTLQNTIAMPSNSLEYPNVINVPYGTDSATVLIGFKMTGIEQHFPKKVAAAFRLTNAGKGNSIDPSKSTIIVVIDTRDVTKLEDIHYLSIAKGGGTVFEIGRGTDYSVTSAGVNIPLGVNLGGVAGKPFSVKAFSDVDTISKLIATDPRFTNAILLPDYEVDTNINFKSNVNTGNLSVRIPWRVFDANMAANKKMALALKLRNPSRHVLHPTNNYVILLLDPSINLDNNSFIVGDGTGLRAEYYKDNQQLDFDGRKPTLTRIDATVDFGGDWVGSAGMFDNYSSRWKGEFLAPVRGQYTFYQTDWDDGSRLFINGVAIIDDFTDRWDIPTRKATIFLERGERYTIEAHHRENVGGQQARLQYEVPSAGIGRQIIPQTQLFPAPEK
ncbi:PA14 domain-containing protein [Desertivirga brevis]|uniref:PA14 domain-containing protein n=1 Tax=Desertivirga brevis TaxID=2810310 RepID=UPI001A961D26|nr:PA14 domain-containing protein [Pedobacter sp. SYSU D00873]